ncbi:MAG: hypothetical protein Q9225_002238 [Loekoesia sp. 1 TL-2023]
MADHTGPASNETGAHGDRQVELNKLIAQATSKYSVKDYDAAAEFYSQATELQAELNGEMAAGNADLLYAYGRCLYHAAVRSSDVLGSKVAGEKQSEQPLKPSGKNDARPIKESTSGITRGPEMESTQSVGDPVSKAESGQPLNPSGKPYFQFTGDENFDDTDNEADAQQADGESGEVAEEGDDFANAFEVLDLARVLLLKRIEEEDGKEQGECWTVTDGSETIRQLKERLADTHDLQAEISLEGERFLNAVDDLRAALDLKMRLFPEESSLIAEAHYKLSLALEFSSVTQQRNEDDPTGIKAEAQIDELMREEAAKEMEAAIASCKLRIGKEQKYLHTKGSTNGDTKGEPRKGKITQQDIDDVKEMVADMEQRLVELRQSPVSINGSSATGNTDGAEQLGGILGSILGESPAAQRQKLEEASRGAKDLSNLVKRKKPITNVISEITDDDHAKNSGKRKVEFVEEAVEVGTGKKVRLSDGDEDGA